jgi:putative transposase
MQCKHFTGEQSIGILKEHEAGCRVLDLARRHGVADNTIYRWKSKFGGMEVSDTKRLRVSKRRINGLNGFTRTPCSTTRPSSTPGPLIGP